MADKEGTYTIPGATIVADGQNKTSNSVQIKVLDVYKRQVLRHRIGLTYEAEAMNMSSDEIVSKILNKVEVP